MSESLEDIVCQVTVTELRSGDKQIKIISPGPFHAVGLLTYVIQRLMAGLTEKEKVAEQGSIVIPQRVLPGTFR